jgi:hypothetical protein
VDVNLKGTEMKNSSRLQLNQIVQCFCLVVLLTIAVHLTNVKANPMYSSNSTGNTNNFKRPGTPTLIDNPGDGSNQGKGSPVYFYYENPALPNPTYGNWVDYWHYHHFTFTHSPDFSSSTGSDSYTKYEGVSYQDGRDRGNATSTSAHWVYRIELNKAEMTYFRPTLDFTAHPTCDISLDFHNSVGSTAPSLNGHLSPAGGELTITLFGIVSVPVSSYAYQGLGFDPSQKDFHVDINNVGSHTAGQVFQALNTVSSFGQIQITNQTPNARAQGQLSWDFYMDTGSNQIPYKFPPPRSSPSLIEFRN